MRVKVIKSFRDKDTNSLHRKGKEIEVTEERFGELIAGPLGVFVEEIQVEPPKEPPTEPPEEEDDSKKIKKSAKK